MHAGQIVTALDKIPTKGPAQGSAVLEAQKINFDISGLPDGFENSMLFPHENPIIIHSDPVTLQPAKNGVRFSASPSYGWEDGTPESFGSKLKSRLMGGHSRRIYWRSYPEPHAMCLSHHITKSSLARKNGPW